MQNHPPWLEELDQTEYPALDTNTSCDMAIIGAGFSGIISAYYILKNTNLSVVLLESEKVARASTAHNAGTLCANIEQSYQNILKLFGKKTAKYSFQILNQSWGELKKIYHKTKLKVPCQKIIGYQGYKDLDHIKEVLEETYLKKTSGLAVKKVYLSDFSYFSKTFDQKYHNIVKVVPQSFINKKLKTRDYVFLAMQGVQEGTLNSALFSQELLKHLVKEYPERLQIFENTKAEKFNYKKNHIKITSDNKFLVTTNHILFTTNSFANQFTKKLFTSKTAHMLGKLTRGNSKKSQSLGYFLNQQDDFYITRRRFGGKNLFAFGGPESRNNKKLSKKYITKNQDFLRKHTYFNKHLYGKKLHYTWKGQLAYTKNNIRVAGQDPKKPNIWYNLGCNGIGLLPSITCAKRISYLISGKKLQKTIFDPT